MQLDFIDHDYYSVLKFISSCQLPEAAAARPCVQDSQDDDDDISFFTGGSTTREELVNERSTSTQCTVQPCSKTYTVQ